VKHGEELICSYFACRNAGIKFRYCSHCKVPVAKRNFRKRHKHGGEEIARIPGEDSEGEDEPVAAKPKRGIPSQITANHKDGGSSESMDSQGDAERGLVRSTVSDLSKKKAASASAAASRPAMAFKEGTNISFDRQKRWMELLERRPSTKDGDSMSTWLMEVLAVSDLDTPLKEQGKTSTVSDSDKARAKGAHKEVVKKMKARTASADPESPRSDAGYGSSNDDSATAGIKKKKKQKTEGKKSSSSPTPPAAAAAPEVIKKKRSAEEAVAGDDKDEEDAEGDKSQPSEFFVSGSFAAWKERKKQKKQAKMSSSGGGDEGSETKPSAADVTEADSSMPDATETAPESEENKEESADKKEEPADKKEESSEKKPVAAEKKDEPSTMKEDTGTEAVEESESKPADAATAADDKPKDEAAASDNNQEPEVTADGAAKSAE